jgi:uncharacterized protein YoxC
MSTLDSDFLIIGTVCISLFFIIAIALAVYAWITFHRIVKKAELAIEGVESVAQVIRDVGKSGSAVNLAKLLKFIFRLSRRM